MAERWNGESAGKSEAHLRQRAPDKCVSNGLDATQIDHLDVAIIVLALGDGHLAPLVDHHVALVEGVALNCGCLDIACLAD